MSDYCQCKDCDYMDFSEKYGYRYHCDRYGTYEDPDEVKECKEFRER